MHRSWAQHNGVLKWLRTIHCGGDAAFRLPDAPITVGAMVDKKGMDYDFDMGRPVEWVWMQMVAHVRDADLEALVIGSMEDPSRGMPGVVSCWFAPRPNSYDHATHLHLKDRGTPFTDFKLRAWDFVLIREDGSGSRLRPQKNK